MNKHIEKKVFSINLGNYGSTGKIAYGIEDLSVANGFTYCCAYPQSRENQKSRKNDYVICSDFMRRINHRLAYHTGYAGCFAVISTLRLLRKIARFQPDLIHLHNIHGDFINIPLLFWYIKKQRIRVVWTLHDCWAFTGRCPYFTMSGCMQWKTGCKNCGFPKKVYPESLVDRSEFLWKLKRKCFTGIQNLTIVTPSKWLADLVKESYLKEYPVEVIYNGIDLSVFKPTKSNFRKKYGMGGGKHIILGVAFGWSVYKGLDVFMKLAGVLGKAYQIVLIGVDQQKHTCLPDSIIAIPKTRNQKELAAIYSAANVFLNPTREEVLGMTNIEALACGTPVITFRTGGSPECVDETCGKVIEKDCLDQVRQAIAEVCEEQAFSREQCVKRAQKFAFTEKYKEYIKLYEGNRK